MNDLVSHYKNDDITIVWKPSICKHSTLCWKGDHGLPNVFNPMERPWIKPHQAKTEEIIQRINACPSGALSFYFKSEEMNNKPEVE